MNSPLNAAAPLNNEANEGEFATENAAPRQIGGHSQNDSNADATDRESGGAGLQSAQSENNLGGLVDTTLERFEDGT